MRIPFLAVAVLVFAPVPASALIHDVAFHGYGRVTYSQPGDDPYFQPPYSPTVGTAVAVTGSIFIGGEAALPDNFTGRFQFVESELFARQHGYCWRVAGGHSGGGSGQVPYQGGWASFVAGRLTAIDVYVDYDGDIEELSSSNYSWGSIFERVGAEWGGTWTLSIPEPSSWAMMIAGFGLAGLRLRSRVAAA